MEHSLTQSISTLTVDKGRRGLLLDFANIFKGFIGTNYLGAAFIFAQSGLILGILGVILISSLAAHCCLLIIKCKNLAIHKLLESHEDWLNSTIEAVENPSRHKLRKRVERRLTYSDVAWIGAGKWGSRVVTGMLLFTQFGFCISYYIFLGNTIRKFFPVVNGTLAFTALTLSPDMVMNSTTLLPSNLTTIFPTNLMSTMYPTNLTSTMFPTDSTSTILQTDLISTALPTTNVPTSTLNSTALPFSTDITTPTKVLYEFMTSNSTTEMTYTTDPSSFAASQGFGGPLYYYFVAALVPIFGTFALFRSIRHLAPGSMVSNFTILFGFVTVMSVILSNFHVSDTVKYASWSTFPIFFGGISSNFEGIGVIVPIESSMGENRRYFPYLLLTTIAMVTTILSTIGILGYLQFGEDIQQVILWSLDSDSVIVLVLYAVIIFGVLFTFPLQNYPVIEICENFLFADGKIFGPSKKLEVDDDPVYPDPSIQTESPLLDTLGDEMDPQFAEILKKLPVAVQISDSVAAWKRNLLRFTIVILEAAFALALKDDYTYFGSFVGAIGATTLGYIMPCYLHIKLTRVHRPLVMVKDVTIIIIGFLGGVAGVYVSIADIVNSFSEQS